MENKKKSAVNKNLLQPIKNISEVRIHHVPGATIKVGLEVELDELIIGQPTTYIKEHVIKEMNTCMNQLFNQVEELCIKNLMM